jgi:pyruvate,orthophosphate dikinase
VITIDGSKGEILAGAMDMVEPELSGDFASLMIWADHARRLKVRANAETPLDARTARGFGAEGIGLCRTEHMFFDEDRIAAVREMILADDEAGRRAALAKIIPFQRKDFEALFEIMAGLPVTIRLLDPPLHEFLPHTDAEIEALASSSGLDAAKLKRRAGELAETNPMLGWRGCRLGIAFPEIYEMQVRAIFEAACTVAANGEPPIVEVMHPLVAKKEEMAFLRKLTDATATAVLEEKGVTLDYKVGVMIELPRAALRADQIAEHAEFFSFGTNDLTQTTFGISRDDSGKFLDAYLKKGIIEKDPFVSLDQEGVGELVRLGAERGRATRPDVKLGICGEHGGDPASIAFCEDVGLDYVSCSPYRVPIARLAAAQAALEKKDA